MNFKKIITAVLAAGMMQAALNIPFSASAADTLIAFPGAEGGGKYTRGARASGSQTVYHVTNLNDSGSGSLRDAVSKSGRIVVFDVGGVIKLNSKLNIGSKVTILGQTAPGDGITITNYDVQIEHQNDVIMRYIRVRPTDDQGGEPDGLGGRFNKNIIVDHCSVSWGVDELLTIYGGSYESGTPSENVTVQYCLSAESLRMSNHIKGAHGYGGIIGGNNASYHHNLFAHHDSRSPRLDRNLQNTDMVNNVIYDWGNTNSVYGAEPYSYNKQAQYSTPDYISRVNLRNNYYKYGPSTGQSLRSRIFEVTNDSTVKYNNEVLKSDFYIDGNYVYGSEDATQNNTKAAYIKNAAAANLLDAPIDMGEAELPIESAEDAYETTLDNVGATLPKRDAIDARVIADVRNQTGRVINNDEEVGGITGFETVKRTFEIPQEWKTANGMGSAKETAIVPDGKWAGYTWIEAYVNDWTEQQEKPANPDITVTSPAIATADKTQDKTNKLGFWTVTADEYDVEYKMQAEAKPGTVITKTEVWDGEALLEAFDGSSSIETELSLKPGTHYLMSKAYNDRGECTVSPTSIVYVTGTDGALENAAEIGTAAGDARGSIAYPGKAAAWTRDDTVYVAGSGFINSGSDSCTYLYYPVKGDFSFSARLADMPKYENGALSGIMFRETLNANSRMAMIAETWYKYGENIVVPVRRTNGGGEAHNWMKDSSGKAVGNTSSYDTEKYPMPKYIKAERSGDLLTLSVSDNGTDWNDNIRQPYTVDVSGWPEDAYIGLAVDSVNGDFNQNDLKTGTPLLPWYTISGFSAVQTENVYGMDLPVPTPTPTATPTSAPTAIPTVTPTSAPTLMPTSTPTPTPTSTPTPTPDIPEYDYRIHEINIDKTNNIVTVSIESLTDKPADVELILAVKDKSAQTLVSAAIEKVEFNGIGSETIIREFGNTDLSDVVIEPFLWNNINEMIPLRVSPEK